MSGCSRHGEPGVGSCTNCGEPICQKCVGMLGQFCTSTCQEMHERSREFKLSDAGVAQREQTERIVKRVKQVALGLVVVACLCILGAFLKRMYHRSWHPYAKLVWQVAPVGQQLPHIQRQEGDELVVLNETMFQGISLEDGSKTWEVDVEQLWLQRHLWDDLLFVSDFAEMRVYGRDGKEMWRQDLGYARKLQTVSRDAILVLEGRTYRRKRDLVLDPGGFNWIRVELTEEEKKWKLVKDDDELDDRIWNTRWDAHYLIAVSTETGKDLWAAPVPQGSFPSPALGEGIGAMLIRGKDTGAWLATFNPKTGERRWQKKLEHQAWGKPTIKDGVITVASSVLERFSVDGEKLPDGEKTLSWNFDRQDAYAVEYAESEQDGNVVNRNGTLIYREGKKERWTFTLPGGITSFVQIDDFVVAIGHATREGGMMSQERQEWIVGAIGAGEEEDDEGAKALDNFINQALTVNDWVMVGLHIQNGDRAWLLNNIGERVLRYGKTAVVIDRRWGTTIYQFRPSDGKELYERRFKEKYLFSPRLVDDKIIGYFYNKKPDDGPSEGLVALNLKLVE